MESASAEARASRRFRSCFLAAVPFVLAALIALAPCSSAYISSISVTPRHPSVDDNVTVGVKGSFPNLCWQVNDMLCGSEAGGILTIDIWATYYDYGSCPPPAVDYEMNCPRGMLPPGFYTLYVAEHHEICSVTGYCDTLRNADAMSDTFTVTATAGVIGGASRLSPPRPNPFTRKTSMAFVVPAGATGAAEIEILDIAGHRVRRLLRENAASGRYVIEWDGLRDDGSLAPSGVYYFSGWISDQRVRRPVVFLK